MEQQEFLRRVRDAARQGQAYRVHTAELPEDVGYAGGGDDLAARLAQEAADVGGIPHLVDGLAEARAELSNIVEQHRPASALCWEHPLLERLQLAELFDEQQVEMVSFGELSTLPQEEQRRQMLAADLGVTSADFAVAETGTVALGSRHGQERAASLLPPLLITVVQTGQIVPDLFDLFARLEEQGVDQLPSNLALITGPSKTGDIELQLTTGVHGPGEWHLIVLRRE